MKAANFRRDEEKQEAKEHALVSQRWGLILRICKLPCSHQLHLLPDLVRTRGRHGCKYTSSSILLLVCAYSPPSYHHHVSFMLCSPAKFQLQFQLDSGHPGIQCSGSALSIGAYRCDIQDQCLGYIAFYCSASACKIEVSLHSIEISCLNRRILTHLDTLTPIWLPADGKGECTDGSSSH